MKIFQIFISLFLLLNFQSCRNENKVEKKFNTWMSRLCCENELNHFKINKFNLIEGNEIEIQLCSAFESNDRLRVTLSQKNRDGNYKYIFDLTKKGRVNKKILIKLYTDNQDFEGYFNQFNKLNDGYYLFSIYANNSCGEIIFKVKNNKKVSEEFLCINYCS